MSASPAYSRVNCKTVLLYVKSLYAFEKKTQKIYDAGKNEFGLIALPGIYCI